MNGVQGAGGSNPLVPTSKIKGLQVNCNPFFMPKFYWGTNWGEPLPKFRQPIVEISGLLEIAP